jgi:hypothetical protein
MPFQFGAPEVILLIVIVPIPVAIVWMLYRVVRRAVRAGVRDAQREGEFDPRA